MRMQDAYVGDRFPVSFTVRDTADPDRKVDSAIFTVYLDGAVTQAGDMAIGEGNLVSFRFEAKREGVHNIAVTWTMGLDRWTEVHRINVRPVI